MFSFLKKYNNLEECLLLKFETDFYNMDVRFYFDYIWEDDHINIRKEDNKKFLIITFHNVKILNMNSHIWDAVIENRHEVDSGLTVIAGAKVIENSALIQNITDSVLPYIHLCIHLTWGIRDNNNIDIVFTGYTCKETKFIAASI